MSASTRTTCRLALRAKKFWRPKAALNARDRQWLAGSKTACVSSQHHQHYRQRLPSIDRRRKLSSFHNEESTIYALSTAPGRAAIAIIRVSGPACLGIYRALCPGKKDPKARHATLRTLYQPGQAQTPESVLDSDALVLYFPAPRTVTGEDVLELHIHGGPAIVKAVLAAIPTCGPRHGRGAICYAEPGEFTRRAFYNDRIGLTQVEALGDTLAATTEQQRRISMRGTTGGLAKRYEGWRQQLLYARGELEALIDFSEDQHFDESPAELCASVAQQAHVMRRTLQLHCENAVRGEMLRNGISLSLLGAPNAGKSSLLNRIVGREAAIVSQEAGTTRDVVEVGIDLGGYFCRIGDTAGLRRSQANALPLLHAHDAIGQVEAEGMRRAKERAATSDAVIVVLSFEHAPTTTTTTTNNTNNNPAVLHLDAEVVETAAALVRAKNNVLVLINKADLVARDDPATRDNAVRTVLQCLPGIDVARIHLASCRDPGSSPPPPRRDADPASSAPHTGTIQVFLRGLVGLFDEITAALAPDGADVSVWQESLAATQRHRGLLESCVGHLDAFLGEVEVGDGVNNDENEDETDIVVAAEHLRAAANCLARITGRGEAGDVEEVLGVVFEKFCVGK